MKIFARKILIAIFMIYSIVIVTATFPATTAAAAITETAAVIMSSLPMTIIFTPNTAIRMHVHHKCIEHVAFASQCVPTFTNSSGC
jgi:hypothetical protein